MSLPYLPQHHPDPNGVGGLYGGSGGTPLAGGASATIAMAIGAGTLSKTGYPSQCLAIRMQALCFAGATVAATNGLQVQVYSCSDSGPTEYDTIAYATMPQIGATASSVTGATIDLPPGVYEVKLTNLDANNSINVALTAGYKA